MKCNGPEITIYKAIHDFEIEWDSKPFDDDEIEMVIDQAHCIGLWRMSIDQLAAEHN